MLYVMLPGLDGCAVCERPRGDGVWSLVLMLTTRDDGEYENRSNVVDVSVRYPQEKVDRPFGVESIERVRGAGYRPRADGGRG